MRAAFTPIGEYGVVGNLETCALVAPDGSVEWLPFPALDSASVFASMLDLDRGGRFRIGPVGEFDAERQYLSRTNVLQTTFHTDSGTATVTDFMPIPDETPGTHRALYRRVACTEGSVDMRVEFAPRFDYGRLGARFERTEQGVRAVVEGDPEECETVTDDGPDGYVPLYLDCSTPLSTGERDTATTTLALERDETEWFVLRADDPESDDSADSADSADSSQPPQLPDPTAVLDATVEYWREWIHSCETADCIFDGPWHDVTVRSGLTLKLLTNHEAGSIAAAATTSLPEDIGGVRNWDYRFSWLRDSAFTVQALSNLGHVDEASAYFEWLLGLCQVDDPTEIQPVYGLHGETELDEQERDYLTGYRRSKPVRVGNDAAGQTQLDIYGQLVLAVAETARYGESVTPDDWTALCRIIEHVREVWTDPDAGIWEVRDGPKQFVHSKVMCWVALDRGIELAETFDRDAPLDDWRETRDEIREEVLDRGYSDELGSFTQTYDGDSLDATALLIPVLGFLPFDDERVEGTIEAIRERLEDDSGLVARYDGDDGLPGEEGAFVLCSFWLVDALVLSGRVDDARELFERLVEWTGPLGLLAEELDSESGRQLGNFPQAFSHIGLINSALYLGAAMGYDTPGPAPMGMRLENGSAH
ncbi:glycoside hydrolase family 15 [Haloprofundus marisrubri]|uniref:Glycoside hydrolase family 15 n=1 Tax=Haloprofundus marisrubri TaxID=1514971 RepID=A0A0W1RCJ3_9EURY|nr:glycoside hydrolase family 15 protein [Haloprofundus marisrubri]KTG10964.1 glycoside hydrolase family 15 [Haloprofundus marisrubri]